MKESIHHSPDAQSDVVLVMEAEEKIGARKSDILEVLYCYICNVRL
jgi:hypothetical protein